MKEENKKKLVKKSVDIESEFIGKSINPVKKKKRKPDLTDEIKSFLSNPIDLTSIKIILMRLSGPISLFDMQNSNIYIYGLTKSDGLTDKLICDFLIKIGTRKYDTWYFLSRFNLFSFGMFRLKELDVSLIKQELAHRIRNWIDNNLYQIKII